MKKSYGVLFALFMTFSFFTETLRGQGNTPIEINMSTIRTELEQRAIQYGVKYIQSLDSLFSEKDIFLSGSNTLFQLTPEFGLQTGTQDAFSYVSAKFSGIFMIFRDTTVAGLRTPNTSRTFHTFPVSIGLESSNNFSTANALFEVGWVPWYQTVGNTRVPDVLKKTKFGLFFQAGYKFEVDTSGVMTVGGEVDQSKEEIDDVLLRAKGSFSIDTQSLFEMSGVGVGVVGSADGWYDFLNSEIYYTVQANIRFYLTADNSRSFDFTYQKGSGAPNFNTGDQFGAGLRIAF